MTNYHRFFHNLLSPKNLILHMKFSINLFIAMCHVCKRVLSLQINDHPLSFLVMTDATGHM